MHLSRRLLFTIFTFCTISCACWVLSVYVPVLHVRNAPVITALFDGKQAMQHLDLLTHKFKSRITGSAQGFAAADYVAGCFRSYGLNVTTQDFSEFGALGHPLKWGWYRGRNVIGVLPGQAQGTVVLTAHRDCVPDAPEGAYDNGSGTAAVMELARVLAAGRPHRYSYAFVALDGEEIGLAGARAMMNNRPPALNDIRLMVNLDMVGSKEPHQLGAAHTQYLSSETRALAAGFFTLPGYMLFQLPMGRGTDAQLFVLRGLPVLDVREIMSKSAHIAIHNAGDTYDQVSADAIEQAGRTIEQLIRQGDAMGAFTPTTGLSASSGTGVLPYWRYVLGGACIFVVFALPLIFRLRSASHGGMPAQVMFALILLTGILTALSMLWRGGLSFVALPVSGTILFLVLQAVAMRWQIRSDPRLGRFISAAVPPGLFAGTWLLTGLWPLGVWAAILAYLPAVLVTWRRGRSWRILDIILILPGPLLTCCIVMAAWILAPTHALPPVKLPLFAALYAAAAYAGIWGVFGRRPDRPASPIPGSPTGNEADAAG